MSEQGVKVSGGYTYARTPEWVLYHPELDDNARVVFAALDRCGAVKYPSLGYLAERLGKSEDTVRRGIRKLAAVGALTVEPQYENGRQTSNHYRLATDAPMHTRPGTDATPEGGKSARDGGSTDATQSRVSKNESSSNESPAANAAGEQVHGCGDELTVNQRAVRIAQGYYDWCRERQRGRKPVSWKVPAMVRLVKPFLEAGVPDPAVKRALCQLFDARTTVTLATLERQIDGRAGRNGKPSMMDGLRELQFDDDGNLVTA